MGTWWKHSLVFLTLAFRSCFMSFCLMPPKHTYSLVSTVAEVIIWINDITCWFSPDPRRLISLLLLLSLSLVLFSFPEPQAWYFRAMWKGESIEHFFSHLSILIPEWWLKCARPRNDCLSSPAGMSHQSPHYRLKQHNSSPTCLRSTPRRCVRAWLLCSSVCRLHYAKN